MIKKVLLYLVAILLVHANMVVYAGNLHGTITWQYNKFIGTRGDGGSTIWLCPTTDRGVRIVYPTVAEEREWISKSQDCPEKRLFYAVADGYGKFEIYDIPEGEYMIWLVSGNTTRDITNSYLERENKEILFNFYIHNKENYKHAEIFMWDSVNKMYFGDINIRKNNNVFNHDFGYKYF